MADEEEKGVKVGDVPSQIFQEFLVGLKAAEISPHIVDGLRKVLLEERQFTERAIKAAVLPVQNPPT